MKVNLKHLDVVECSADALIYSTNVLLNCSGGVGSTLMTRYGNHIQSDLHQLLQAAGKKFASRGDVYEFVSEGMPYKMVFHTVPCDGFYETSREIVTEIMVRCLERCVELGEIRSIAISALASGYGNMEVSEFLQISSEVLSRSKYGLIESATICIYDEYLFDQACQQITQEGLKIGF